MELFFLIHLTLMLLGFLLLVAGVITVRYFRKKMWWFRLHKRMGFLATISFFVGGIAAVLMVYLSGGNHFAVPHTWLGVIVIVIMAGTLVAGLAQTRVINKTRMRLVHRTLGRTVAVLSLLAVATGAIVAGIIPGP